MELFEHPPTHARAIVMGAKTSRIATECPAIRAGSTFMRA